MASAPVAATMSLLDTDLYKLTMQQAVLQHFPDAVVRYKFTNRSKGMSFTKQCMALFEKSVEKLADAKLQPDERAWLEKRCPYFSTDYLDYLSAMRLHPSRDVSITFIPEGESDRGQIEIIVSGKWSDTILWEVPLMACLSEAYFQTVDTDWSYDGQEEYAYRKGVTLLNAGAMLSEFGTRRRRSLEAQRLVLQGLLRARDEIEGTPGVKGAFRGTSNVHLAHVFDLMPIGTIAHEWTMGIAALEGYKTANATALALWEVTYPPTDPPSAMHIALTDTFTSDAFFSQFTAEHALKWKGLRQDSGDPIKFARRAKAVYEQLGVNWKEKVVIFSDGLDVEKCVNIVRVNEEELGFQASFGVGTFLTNDFRSISTGEKSKALNIVIKLAEIDGNDCVKLSDDVGKNMGNPDTVKRVKETLGLV